MYDLTDRPLFSINVFTPKLGRADDFIRAYLESVPRLGVVPGLQESRLFRAEDGSRVIIAAGFTSAGDFRAFQGGAAFHAQREVLAPLIDRTEPRLYRLIHERERIA